ncbi:MAG TPA: phenylalanine--tRNA ligase subunit beta, partial [Firmicutes bacterium]|nr:phenylalanine--tRNA ligase subunit beta [Bacillota bacterium]
MMRISTNWLNDYVDISDENLRELADKITNAGVNVETVEEYSTPNLVVGQILEIEDHPDSDHLHVCKVDVKNEVLQIICGAKNLEEKMKVIVSKVGCVLPGGEIKKSVMRGVESQGMLCALMELDLEENTPENYAKGIHKLPDEAIVGSNPYKYLGLDDVIYNLDLNPNREADCTNHIGFAYEVASILGKKVTMPDTTSHPIKESVKDEIKVSVKTDNCTMYNARKVKNVVIKESPDFIKERLTNAGMRPINNVVDISNYIMLEYGQPLHFFDAEKLGDEILVRMAEDGEEITTLDGVKRVLCKDDIVITDGVKPVCIAGVMGGANSGIDENTKNVVIESAIFDPLKIRYTSKRLDLSSEASRRYEHGLNYEYTAQAIDRACHLLEKYADALVLSDTVVYDATEKKEKIAKVTVKEINSLLGLDIPLDAVKEAFTNLQFPYELKGEEFTVTIPNRRSDVAIKEDLIEEVGRLFGYQHIVSKMPKLDIKKGSYVGNVGLRKSISKRLRSLGLNETRTYTLISPEMSKKFAYGKKEEIVLLRPMSSDKSIVRTSILPSLLNVYEYNVARNTKDVNVYEIANVYYDVDKEETKLAILMSGNYIESSWQGIKIKSDFYVLKGIVSNLLEYLGYQGRYSFIPASDIRDMHPGATALINVDNRPVGYMGRVMPNMVKDEVYVLEISLSDIVSKKTRSFKFKELSKFPSVSKDVAFIMKNDMPSLEVEKEIARAGGKLLKEIKVFDVYRGENVEDDEKSIAYSLLFEDETRTLTTEEVNELFNKIIDTVSTKLNLK